MKIDKFIPEVIRRNASDLHLRPGSPPVARVDGKLVYLDFPELTSEETRSIAEELMSETQRQKFLAKRECDLALNIGEFGRFRINIYQQRGMINLALRRVPDTVPKFSDLHLPAVLTKIAENQRGLILVTGTTGSGKSTTLAAIVDYINENRSVNIITIEDPIEYIHRDKKSIVNQRELGFDTLSYHEALKNIVRQDPDVILVGEMRDLETMAAALTAAQTGHLVLSTVHTIDAIQTVSRVVDLFPPYQQTQIRYQLADTLKAVISQRLLPHASGSGRVPAVEILINTALVKKYIEENNLSEITNLMKQGSFYGMQTFNQALLRLYENKEIKLEDALSAASNPEELLLAIRGIESGASSHDIIDRSF